MSWTLITQLRGMQERECASLGDMADQTAGRAADALEREMQRAETAEARVKELELKLMRQDEVAREAYEAAVWKYGQERMELEARVKELEAALRYYRTADFLTTEQQQRAEEALCKTNNSVTTNNGHTTATCEATTGRIATLEARVAELEAQNARLRAALERLDALYISEFDHEDRPPRPQWLQAALNGEEAST